MTALAYQVHLKIQVLLRHQLIALKALQRPQVKNNALQKYFKETLSMAALPYQAHRIQRLSMTKNVVLYKKSLKKYQPGNFYDFITNPIYSFCFLFFKHIFLP